MPVDVTELQSLKHLAVVPAAGLADLARASYAKRLSRGQLLFTAGEPSEHLYVIRSGRIKIMIDSDRGDALLLTVLSPGDLIGELSMIDGLDRSTSAEALDASTVLALPAAQIRQVLTEHPAALMAMAVELATSLRRVSDTAADLVLLDLPRRLAKLILIRTTSGRAELGLTQSDLAAQLGVTRQALNRALGGLVKRGWMTADGTAVQVHDLPALARFARG